MTKDLTPKKTLFVRADLFIDFLMTAGFCFTILSLSLVMKLYVQIVDLSYSHFLSLLIPAFLFILVRRLRVKLPLMLLGHFIIFVFYLYVMNAILVWGGWKKPTVGTVILGIAAFANVIYSMLQRIRRTIGEVTYDVFIASFALHIVLYIVCAIMNSYTTTMIMAHAVIIAILYFVARQLYTFDRRYYHNLHSATQPVSKIKRQNYQTTLVIFGGVFFALLLLFFFPTGALKQIITKIIQAIGGFIGSFFDEPDANDSSGGEMIVNKLPDLEDDGSGPSLFTKIVVALVVVIIVCMFVAAIVFLIRQFVKLFKQAEDTERVVENDSVVDIIEDVTPKRSRSIFSRMNFGTGREKEIRKKYYHKVQKAISSGTTIRPAYTPHQIESALIKQGDQSITELTSQYESVRYGKKEE